MCVMCYYGIMCLFHLVSSNLQYRDLVPVLRLQQLVKDLRHHDERVRVRCDNEIVLGDRGGGGHEHPLQLNFTIAQKLLHDNFIVGAVSYVQIKVVRLKCANVRTCDFRPQGRCLASTVSTTWLPPMMHQNLFILYLFSLFKAPLCIVLRMFLPAASAAAGLHLTFSIQNNKNF